MTQGDIDTLNLVLLVVRVAAGITLALHGYQKFFMGGRIQGTAGWFESLGMKPGKLHAYLAACTEISCGLGFAAGFLTPLTAAGGVGILTVATWTHKGKFFIFKDGWEYNAMLAALFILIATVGPGRWSIDNALDLTDDLSGTTGLLVSLIGVVAAVGLMLVFWRPPVKEPASS
ncbi:MAG TPA: DoxX family protein [Acidimicrobiales bacterium]|nr:DoxX family protein [Acidimicrobiales bacterium]